MTIRALYEETAAELRGAGVPDAEVDARLLLERFCGISRTQLLADGEREVEWQQEGGGEDGCGDGGCGPGGKEGADKGSPSFCDALARRKARIPLQHILGSTEFMGLEFRTNADALIPRPDTEILVEEVLRELRDGFRILDLCTGSGCILISLLRYSNGCSGVGTDLSERALALARENAERLLEMPETSAAAGASEAPGGTSGDMEPRRLCGTKSAPRAAFLQGDLYGALGSAPEGRGERFDIIVSNPPYIPSAEIERLEPEVRDHDPRSALDGGADGLDFYRRIIAAAPEHLCGGGMLFLEIGFDQARDVSGMLEHAGFREVRVFQDYGERDRVVRGTLPCL